MKYTENGRRDTRRVNEIHRAHTRPRRRLLRSAWGALLLLAGSTLSASGQELVERLESLVRKLPRSTTAGIAVHDATSGEILYQHESDQLLKPASVMKLLTSAAALERFGPDFAYETRVYISGDELWIIGGGDPSLGDERIAHRSQRGPDQLFDAWAEALRERGLTRLSKIVMDDSIFDRQFRHPDWPESQADRWYQAPVGAVNYNDNCVDITVRAGTTGLELVLRPELPADFVVNRLTRRAKGRQRITLKRAASSDIFELSGTVRTGGALDPVAVREPTIFFAAATRTALQSRGIEVAGDAVRRPLVGSEGSATLLDRHMTPLPDVLWRCNRFSQNLFAECLLKSLAAYEPDGRRSGIPGSWEAGTNTLRQELQALGAEFGTARVRDGSGLSHENRVSAGQLVQLLRRMYFHPHAEVFRASLAQPDEPGSLSRRYDEDADLRGKLLAKTGTLNGVHALAGYVTRRDGRAAAFAILVNGPAGAELPYEMCKILATAP